MDSVRNSTFPLLFFLLFCFSVSTEKQFSIPRLGARRKSIQDEPNTISSSNSEDLQTFFFTQTLDHFNYKPDSYTTFQQRYMINFKYWGGPNVSAPIFVCFGGEESLDYDVEINGFLPENAPRFKALLVYIEVRIFISYFVVLFASWCVGYINIS